MESISSLGPLCGGCKLGDYGQEVRHILCPKRRAEMLRNDMDNLNRFKEGTQEAVREKITQNPWSKMHPHVNAWILSVEALSARVDEILQGDLPFWKRFCFCHTYEVGDKIQQYLEEVERINQRFDAIRGDLVVDSSSIHDLEMKLQDEMEKLRAGKKDLESEVKGLEMEAVFHPVKMSAQVESWMKTFRSLEAKVSELVADDTTAVTTPNEAAAAVSTPDGTTTEREAERELKGDIWAMIRRVAELSEQLKELKQEGRLVVKAPPQPFHELPGDRSVFVVGIEEKLKEIETLLDDGKPEVILIHGMGGSGKTTLVRELTKKLRSKGGNGFDSIFSVVVSQNLDIHKIQGDILVQLGYRRGDQSLAQDVDDRSMFLEEKLNKKSFLLVLDDLWEPLHDLPSKLGFHPSSSCSSSRKCKVVVTSRKADVCDGIESIAALKIGLLEKEHAWELFCKKSGLVEPDEPIRSIAKEIAEKCGGLPLLLKTVASAMLKNRNYDDWFGAKNQLHNYPDAIRNMGQVYERLKFSFDRLENDGLRVCLLYCALFPEDDNIIVNRLIRYLLAEGFVDGRYDFDTLWHKACHDIIEKLKESSLLETGKDDEFVKLHDAVREMLLWLGEDWKVLSFAEKGVERRMNVDSWKGVRMALISHTEDIEKIANGEVTLSSLRTLLVEYRVDLPTSLQFSQFSSLRILDLSENKELSEIPKSIGSLKSLLYLNLSQTRIKVLPVEIGNLTNLHTLHIWCTWNVSIPRDAISPLKMLQSLNLFECDCFEDEKEGMLKVVDVSTQLPKLKDVGLSVYRTIDVDVAQRLFPLTSQLSLRNMDIDNVTSSKLLKFQRLKLFWISNCTIAPVEFLRHENFPRLKSLRLFEVRSRNIILKSPHWCLQKLMVFECDDFEHLGWIRHLPNLTELNVNGCKNLQELVPKDMSEENKDESSCRYDDPTIPLSKLKDMTLMCLPKLESISSGNLSFPCLTDMEVFICPRIRSLPIKSSNSLRTTINCKKEWWESLEWEDDECSSARFIPDHTIQWITEDEASACK